MSRRIISQSDAAAIRYLQGPRPVPNGDTGASKHLGPAAEGGQTVKADDYSARVLKLIPAEVVAAFVTIDGIIKSSNQALSATAYWMIFLLMAAGTYLYTVRIANMPPLVKPHLQAALTTVSFVVWVFAIGGPFLYSASSWYTPIYGALILPLYTFFVPIMMTYIADQNTVAR